METAVEPAPVAGPDDPWADCRAARRRSRHNAVWAAEVLPAHAVSSALAGAEVAVVLRYVAAAAFPDELAEHAVVPAWVQAPGKEQGQVSLS